MKKTNIRVNNNFIIEDNGKYYLSKIIEPEKWIEVIDEELEIMGNDITSELLKLIDEYEISSNVNFCGFDLDIEGGGSS